ncbi:hypothetical protein GCM10027570_17600 [Streptomonospora sediminis]
MRTRSRARVPGLDRSARSHWCAAAVWLCASRTMRAHSCVPGPAVQVAAAITKARTAVPRGRYPSAEQLLRVVAADGVEHTFHAL